MQTREYPTAYGDIKYYWRIHRNKMMAQGDDYVTYDSFCGRLRKMNLFDAIHLPRANKPQRVVKSKTPIQDNIRRIQVLKEQNIQILGLDKIDKVFFNKQKKVTPKHNMKPKKTSLLDRFISLFR